MDYLNEVKMKTKLYVWLLFVFGDLMTAGLYLLGTKVLNQGELITGVASVVISIIVAVISTGVLVNLFSKPIEAVWQAVQHLYDDHPGVPAPVPENLSFGKELATNLIDHIYQLITASEKISSQNEQASKDLSRNFIAKNLPIPLIVLDATETIKYANMSAAQYIGTKVEELLGKNVYMVLDMAFPNTDTFDNWLKESKLSSATAVKNWERVKLDVRDNHPMRLFDLAAYYNRDNADNNETMMLLFDHTATYSQDEQAVSFVALAVHELRTPLTLLKGYIEVFQEDLSGKVTPEIKGYMDKMQSQADQLTAFINNILNVARIETDQLELKLEQLNWSNTLKTAIENLSIRAKVRGVSLHCSIANNLPTVAAEQLSIIEVLNNLIDNALKYSGDSKVINISTKLNSDGLIETTVQDFGLGISAPILSSLFTKFYRDHHNRAQVGGTGLGLYLAKAIVEAHGGNIWVKSKPGEGSTFGFTILPYSSIDDDKKNNNQEIVRSAHGWIKNHSLYRR
jgi:signal transduction histidine kinase